MKLEQANKMTAQELCDYAVSKIVEQGGRSVSKSKSSRCLMMDAEGRRCAFSWLLDGDDPACMGFGASASAFLYGYPGKSPKALVEDPGIAVTLQLFHDTTIKESRILRAKELNDLGISTDAPQYQQWIDMGE